MPNLLHYTTAIGSLLRRKPAKAAPRLPVNARALYQKYFAGERSQGKKVKMLVFDFETTMIGATGCSTVTLTRLH